MTNKTITALIIRIAGFALFVKIFDFFGTYFMSIYLTSQMLVLQETNKIAHSFDKLFYSGTFITFANLFISIFLIIKANWIANKLVKNESEFKLDLNPIFIMRIIIASLGIIYCAHTIFNLPTNIENFMFVLKNNEKEMYIKVLAGLTKFVLKAAIGVLFIFKSEQISKLALKTIKTEK